MPRSTTQIYTDVARTAAVTAGHSMELAGRAAAAFGCPIGQRVERAGRAIATGAVEACSHDTPRLERSNGGGGRR